MKEARLETKRLILRTYRLDDFEEAIVERGTADVDEIIRALARAMEERFGAGSLQVPLRAHVATAVKP